MASRTNSQEEPRGRPRLRAVLASPGALPLLAARSLGSLPIGMVPLGIILLLRAKGHGYALAGLADGAYAAGVAVMQPPLGRLIDRFGMVSILGPLTIVFPGTLVAFILAASAGAPAPAIVALALLSGATLPPLGACMRVLWPRLVAREGLRGTAFALDATMQELSFVLGPPLLALLVAVAGARTGLFAAAGAGLAGTAVFAVRARPHRLQVERHGGALRSAGVRRVLAVSLLLGGGFGAVEVALPAFSELHGARPAAGLLLAALAFGSACGGLAFGGRGARLEPHRRLAICLGAYAVLATPLLVVPSIPLMALCIFVSGLPIAPVFAGSYTLLDRHAVAGTLTETFAWNTTMIFVGASIGTAVGGALIASVSYRASVGLSVVLGAAALLFVLRRPR
ncbi:MAG TPA: MFS transporter [Solirubrobacteraceae bacterium]|nr:MFS transporter [Solirubrobacteraceae bacterium]